ncbi:hypothetical protein [Morganella morganii]|uniref:hypothetical protein n=1 Tax=Morganella morganii TaxID=582 RepID=UPI00298DD1D6|nr:hypothetical protein [Morganella morganii]MDW7782282.1 hypothetical protein [Morganella morganii]MDW7792421.1 hypothetical protein [Morganella morganii]
MNKIAYLPRTGKTNAKQRRYAARGELMARKAAEDAAKGRSTEEIWDSVFGRPADETDVFAGLIIGLKDAPEAPRKQLRMNRKPIMPNGDITARA